MSFVPVKQSLLCEARQRALHDAALKCVKLPGAYLECGVYQGGSALLIAKVLKEKAPEKKLHLFDSWNGLDVPLNDVDLPGLKDPYYLRRGFLRSHESECVKLFKECDVFDMVKLHKGLMHYTLAEFDEMIAFGHIDCDQYAGTKVALDYIASNLCRDAIIVVDDFSTRFPGVVKAVQEFINRGECWHHEVIEGTPDNAVKLWLQL